MSTSIEAVDISDYSKLIEKIAKDLHQGKIKGADFNEDLVRQIYTDLNKATGKGYGKTYTNYERDPGRKLKLAQNVFKFSAAKAYQEQAKLNYLLYDEKGNRRTIAEFRKEAAKLNIDFNQTHLKTEVGTFQRAAAQVKKWAKYEDQKDLYPNLQYKTAGDKRVRDDHDAVDDVIKPIDDKFWDTWYPPNGWNCRCYVVQTGKTATNVDPKGNPTMGFHNNVGKTARPMDEEHPYFIFPKKEANKIRVGFEELKLKDPIYKEIYRNGKAKLEGSIFSDPKDVGQNISIGKLLVDQLKVNVSIRPHVNPAIIKHRKNPEYTINGKVADLKNINSNSGITNGFKRAKDQMGTLASYRVVFNLDAVKKINVGSIIQQIENKVSQNRGKKITSLFFTYKSKAIELTRAQILNKEFDQLKDLLK